MISRKVLFTYFFYFPPFSSARAFCQLERYWAFALFFLLSFQACKTDLDVNAPYKEITVVYGLLNQNDTIHFIKINKSFLGEADAYAMASVRDSSEYKSISAKVTELKNGAKTGREWALKDSIFTNKESGDFYFPEQKVYYFTESGLDPAAQYELNVSLNNGEKTVTAKTDLVNSITDFTGGQQFVIPCSGQPGTSCIGFASSRGKYIDKEFTWRSVKDGKRYQLEMSFYYRDEMADGSGQVTRKMNWTFQPPLYATSLSGGEGMSVIIKGEDFYKEIARQLTPLTDATILRRFFDRIEFNIYVAADDFNTYLLANEPSTGIIQEKPEFTNVENGIGIFSARFATTSPAKLFDVNSLDELVGGQHTFTLKFCRFNPSNGELLCN